MKRHELILPLVIALTVLAFALGYTLAASLLPNQLRITAIACDGSFSVEEITPLRRYD